MENLLTQKNIFIATKKYYSSSFLFFFFKVNRNMCFWGITQTKWMSVTLCCYYWKYASRLFRLLFFIYIYKCVYFQKSYDTNVCKCGWSSSSHVEIFVNGLRCYTDVVIVVAAAAAAIIAIFRSNESNKYLVSLFCPYRNTTK